MEIVGDENEENNATKKKPLPLQHQQVASTSSTLHSTQSQPNICEDGCAELRDNKKKGNEKGATARRVSFASSSQLTQYLEPINPFESFGKSLCNKLFFSTH
jgi:hypothetical protein